MFDILIDIFRFCLITIKNVFVIVHRMVKYNQKAITVINDPKTYCRTRRLVSFTLYYCDVGRLCTGLCATYSTDENQSLWISSYVGASQTKWRPVCETIIRRYSMEFYSTVSLLLPWRVLRPWPECRRCPFPAKISAWWIHLLSRAQRRRKICRWSTKITKHKITARKSPIVWEKGRRRRWEGARNESVNRSDRFPFNYRIIHSLLSFT